MPTPASFADLPVEVALVVEVLLREFDRQAAAGKTPVDEYLAVVAEPYRGVVRKELEGIAAEYASRRTADRRGDTTAPHSPEPDGRPAPYRPVGVPYRLGRVLGRGGFGTVFEAFDEKLDRVVALKVLRSPGGVAGATLGTSSERFRDEARRLAGLRHENIVRVHDTGLDDNRVPFLVMEYVPRTLDDRIAERPPPGADPAAWRLWVDEAATILRSLAAAVTAAHSDGIVHGDLKPANVLLDGTRPKLADFGAARLRGLADDRRPAAIGTPAFMAPEQLPGTGPVTERTDVYGLGAVLYVCLTGNPPFPAPPGAASDTPTVLNQVRTRDPLAVRTLEPRAPAAVAAIVAKCLAKDPAARYASAADLAADLDRWLTHHPVTAHRAGVFERLRLWRRRNVSRSMGRILTTAAFALVALAAAAGLAFAKYQSDQVAKERETNAKLDAQATALREANARLAAENRRNALQADALEKVGGPVIAAALIARHDPAKFKELNLAAITRGLRAFDDLPAADISPRTRRLIAFGYLVLAHKERDANRHADAEKLFRRAVPLLEAWVAADPDDREARGELATALYYLGAYCRDDNRPKEWKAFWAESRKVSEKLVSEDSDTPHYRANLGQIYYNLGVAASDGKENAEAEKMYAKALETLLPVAVPGKHEGWFVFAASNNRGELRAGRGEHAAALDDFARSVRFAPTEEERKEALKYLDEKYAPLLGEKGVGIGLARVSAAAKYVAAAVLVDGLWPTLEALRHPDFVVGR